MQPSLGSPQRAGGVEAAFQPERLVHVAAQTGDESKDMVQRGGSHELAAVITREITKPQMHET